MQTEKSHEESQHDDKNRKNAEVFNIIKGNLSSAEKLKQITQYLKEGADINSLDVNNKNSTLLHVAAIKGEVEVVKLLLNKGANATITNDDNDTVIDIIQLTDTPNNTESATIIYKKYGYQKRPGTSGVRGELYETKLLSLILFRALYDKNIKHFILGTNLDDIGALDDIIIRYSTNDTQMSKILFLQAKHRENEIITVDDLLNPKKETNLHKYFESYVKIRYKFVTDNDNTMFQGAMKNIDCKFVIYTSAKQYIDKNQKTQKNILKGTREEENLIKASKQGKVLQIKYDNEFDDTFEDFISTACRTRAIVLAQSLIKFIVKDNSKFKNMMLDNLIKEYHIYLAQNVIETKDATSIDTVSHSSKATDHLIGQFRSSFLTSDDENLQLIKLEIYKELAEIKKLSPKLHQIELDGIMKLHTFKLPTDFGNHHFSLGGNKTKQQKRLVHFCSIFEKIFQDICIDNSKYIYINLDDDSVGPNEIVQSKDLEIHWLGALVGNLLINDSETEMLKFNLDKQSLSEDNIKILEQLKSSHDDTRLSMFRFNINFLNFPKLTLNSKPCKEYDRKLMKHFLDNLRIYTNQAKEDEVETVLKNEIYTLYDSRKQHSDFLFHIKCDAVFLTVHDNIQKWWKQPNSAPYLTENCKFYHEVEQEILDSPLISVLHYICCKNINNSSIDFEKEAIDSLKLNEFLKSKDNITIIISDEINFSSIKVIKYLNENKSEYKFINLNYEIVETCYEIILNELVNSNFVNTTLVIMSQVNTDFDYWKLCKITEIFKGKIIIITNNNQDNLKIKCSKRFIYRDRANNFSNLSSSVRKIILEERQVIFQGLSVIVKSVLSDSALDLFSPTLLWKIVHNDKIIIGNKLDVLDNTSGDSDRVITDYIKRTISRLIAINTNKNDNNELFFKEDDNTDRLLEENKDVIVITESEDTFKEICKTHSKANVHWFTRLNTRAQIVWNKSRGSIKTLMKYVDRSLPLPFAYQFRTNLINLDYKVITLKDVQDRTVIINAEPGMGKSTLLTYLAMNTKRIYPNLWILKINLLDRYFLDQFCDWNERKTNIDMVQVMMFLYSAVNKKYYTNNDISVKISKLITVSNVNEIHFSVYDDEYLPEVDLSELKLLNYFYNHNSLVVLLDGFDEICPDYTDEVVQLLNNLKTSKVANLWITSRPYNGLEKLELALGTFSFTLDPLKMREQIQFLQNVWAKKFCQDKTLDVRKQIYVSVCDFYAAITDALDGNMKFTSIPLHLYMISEIYHNLLKQYIDYKLSSLYKECNKILNLKGILNFITLYEKFTYQKFHMQFEEKNSSMNSKDPYIKKLKQDAYKLFIKNHKNIAAYLLLDKSVVLSEYDIESVHEFILDVKSDSEKIGIIKCIDNNPKFVHYTFAEYFAAEFLFDKLKSGKSCRMIWQYMLENILLISDKHGLRRFINSKLERDRHIINFMSNEEHMTIVFDILLAQFINLQTSAIFVAIEKYLEYIAVFLLECIKAPVNKINLPTLINILHKKCNKFCVICMALTSGNESVTKHLMELFRDIDCSKLKTQLDCQNINNLFTKNDEICVSLNTLLHLDQLTVKLVEGFLMKNGKEFVPTSTVHWILGRHGLLFTFCYDFVATLSTEQRLQLFNDEDFKSLSMYDAAKKIHYNWVSVVGSTNREEFIKMCSSLDNSVVKSVLLMLRNVLINVYNKADLDVEDFIFKKLSSLALSEVVAVQRRTLDSVTKNKPYSSQLPNLVLLRLLFDDHINKFIITSSVTDIYHFKSLVIRYLTTDSSKSKMIFLQLQNPIDEDLLTLNEKSNLLRYFQSYLQVREKFRTDNINTIFQGNRKNIDYKFILYTTTKNKFSTEFFSQSSDEYSLIKTNNDLKIYKYVYTEEHIETLVYHLSKFRAIELGICLSSHISSALCGFSSMSRREFLMNTYHVFIAQKIIEIESSPDESHNFSIGRFHSSFLTSDDEKLGLIRHEMHKKIADIKGITLTNHQLEVESIMKNLRFELVDFGKYSFSFYGSERDQQEKLDRLLSIFENLFKNHQRNDFEYTFIEFDDFSIRSDDNFQITDLLQNDSLAGLVGNLLILDERTETLKINFSEETLSYDNVKVLNGLKQKYDNIQLSRFRFDINVHGFPKLSLNNTDYDRNLAKDFLNNLEFYTGQASDDEVEDILKQDLNKYFNILKRQNDFLFRVKCDAIFLSFLALHDTFDPSWRLTYSTECYKCVRRWK